jgi:DNA-directed RNA polymerase subunit alpha
VKPISPSAWGAAVTHVKIGGVSHAFSTLSGVKETALEVLLNLKLLRFKVAGTGPFTLTYSGKTVGIITGADFKGGNVEVVNKDQYIAEVTSPKAKLDIELTVDEGLGFLGADEKEKKDFGVIAVDSAFSPVRRVNYSIEGARVGRKSDYDKLILEIWTDGTINPTDALQKTSEIVSSFFGHILSGRDSVMSEDDQETNEAKLSKEVDKKVYQTIIDELDLPTRVINALLREKIETVEDLLKRGKEELVGLKGVGRKSVDLIGKELDKLGIPF